MAGKGNINNLTHMGKGRPKGAKNKPKSADIIAQKLVREEMEGLIGTALDTVKKELDTGSASMAWRVLNRFAPHQSAKDHVDIPLPKMETYADVEAVSSSIIEAAMTGTMAMQDADRMLSLLTMHAGISGYIEVEKLRVQLGKLAEMKTVTGEKVVPEESRVTWGKNLEDAKPANKLPGE